MDANIDINRQTHQGTALHEAALYGKINAVRLLIDVSLHIWVIRLFMMEKNVEHTSGFVITKTQLWLVFVACLGGSCCN